MVNDMTRAEAYWILEEIRKESFSADYAQALGIAQETIEFVDLMPKDMVPVVHGVWMNDGMGDMLTIWKCSLCGYRQQGAFMRYCPNCGAKMKVGE